MTDRELRRLRRSELLEMMLESRQAAAAAEERAARAEEQALQMRKTSDELRGKLDDRDEEIRSLIAELRRGKKNEEGGERA